MPVCSFCHVNLPSIRSLLIHLEIRHSVNNKFKCGEKLCFRTFSLKNSFRKHLQATHKFPIECEVKEKTIENDLCSNSTLEINSDFSESNESNINDNMEFVTSQKFSSLLRHSIDLFVAKLYSNPHFPRNLIQKVVVDSSLMVGSEYVALLRQKVINVLQTSQCAENEIQDIEIMFKTLENPFKHLQSEYLRFQYFSNLDYYVAPIPYEMGKMFCAERCNNTMKGKYISVYGQYIPLDSILQKFFELPGALKETLNYMDFLEKKK